VARLGYEVDAFIEGWKGEKFTNLRRHFVKGPDIRQF